MGLYMRYVIANQPFNLEHLIVILLMARPEPLMHCSRPGTVRWIERMLLERMDVRRTRGHIRRVMKGMCRDLILAEEVPESRRYRRGTCPDPRGYYVRNFRKAFEDLEADKKAIRRYEDARRHRKYLRTRVSAPDGRKQPSHPDGLFRMVGYHGDQVR
ncbi:hypothetical protein ES705_36686 [subsurface metagenome]